MTGPSILCGMREGVHDLQAPLEKSHPGEKQLSGHQYCHQHELLCFVVKFKQAHGLLLLLKRLHTHFAFLPIQVEDLHGPAYLPLCRGESTPWAWFRWIFPRSPR